MAAAHLMNTYGRLPVSFTHGEGVWLYDTAGRKYLDALSGVAVCSLGHAHPAIAAAICDQAGKLLHTSNWFSIPLQERLGEALCSLSSLDRAFFCNSGAEANEAAIKLARLAGHKRGNLSPAIVVMEGSFHGRTLATLSATGNRKIQAGFEPLVQGFYRAPYNDLEALRRIAANRPEIVAVLVEPIIGEGGVLVPDSGYLAGVREICDQHGWLMMLDEVQTGMGRTGRWFGFQHAGIVPDVLTLAKALGNGVPIGACLARGAAADLFSPGHHGSTFGGNPLACRAALAVIEIMTQQNLPARAAQLGERLQDGLRHALAQTAGVRAIRGQGCLVGIELDRPCKDLLGQALDRGIILNVTADRVVRLLPPLILSNAEADLLIHEVATLIQAFLVPTAEPVTACHATS